MTPFIWRASSLALLETHLQLLTGKSGDDPDALGRNPALLIF